MERVRRPYSRTVAAAIAVVLVAAACSNSKSQTKAKTTLPKGTLPPGATTTIGDIKKFVHLDGVKGVTDKTIRTTAVIAVTNLIGGHYKEMMDGVNAYFAMVNSEGGIYGRKLVNVRVRDDQGGNNLQETQNSLAQDNAFANFGATYIQFSGAGALDQAGQPAFIWNINPEFGGHNNIFANETALCFDCSAPTLPWFAKQTKRHRVGILGYGVPSSKLCGQGTETSFKDYGAAADAKVVYRDYTIGFGQQLTSQVAKMKQAHVDLVATCMDLHETQILGKELKKQGLDAIQTLPNGYDAGYIAANADVYEGAYVASQYTALEHQPQIPEIKLFLSWLQKTGKKFVELSAVGWILADMFVTGLKLAGPNFTQAKVIDAINSLTNYSDNGFIQPINWSKGHIDPEKDKSVLDEDVCSNWVKVHNGKFEPVFDEPGKQWICLPRSDKTLTKGKQVTFAPQG
jgi:ABC-type branched-subunit amino acid transport system substrate-binding protein